ncbi:hypothetical protein [Viridibacillus arvi]|uniref:hypothetical protein n=1 Tax=Viridibacillus arvi TaxID=263475 RepID=UPI0034CDCAFF
MRLTDRQAEEKMIGVVIYVGSFEEFAEVKTATIYPEAEKHFGYNVIGTVGISYTPNAKPEEHAIFALEGEDWQVDGYISHIEDITVEGEKEYENLYMSEMLS